MSRFEAWTNYNHTSGSTLVKMFFWKFFISTLLPILRNSSVLLTNQINSYDDFTPTWYLTEGNGLILAAYGRCFVVTFIFFFRYFYGKVVQGFDQNFTGDATITRQKTHKDYEKVYTNDAFDIYLSYAEILNLFYFSMTFGLILPHIFIPSFIMLILIYYKDKILSKFQK